MPLVNSCKFCHREGLAILPVRARIIHDDPDTPINCKLPQTVEVPVESTQQTKYVGSVLQDGYLYIYNERAQTWLDFYVTPDNYYYRLITGISADESVKAGNAQPCATKPEEQSRAAFICLPYFRQPEDNGVFWFAWAKVEWTDAVRKRYEDADYRAQYMQPFDMQKWVACQQEKNCYELQQLKSTVLEYQHTKLPKVTWATEFFNEKNHLLKYAINRVTAHSLDLAATFYSLLTDKNPGPLITEAVRISGRVKPAIIVLNDPTAIMEDIGKLCDAIPNQEIYCNPKYERGIWLNSTLEAIKGSVVKSGRETAEESVETSIEGMINESYLPSSLGLNTEEYAELMREAAERQAEYGWKHDYEKYLDTTQQTAFMATVNTLTEKLAKDVIKPLIDSFHTLIFHPQTVNYFIGNFDTEDIKSGAVFSQIVISAFLPMLSKKVVLDECIEMLKAKKLADKHYFVRAYYLNQKQIEDALEQAFSCGDIDGLLGNVPLSFQSTSPDLSGLPWQNIVESIEKANLISSGKVIQSMDEVFHTLSAPLLPLFSQGLHESMMVRSVALASAIRYMTLKPVQISGTYEQIVRILQQKGIDVMEGQGKTVSQNAKFAAKNALNEGYIKPQGKAGNASFKVYLFLDSADETRIKSLPPDKRLDALREALEILTESKYKAHKSYLKYQNEVFGVKVSGVSAVIQAFILYKTSESVSKEEKGSETYNRWIGGGLGLAGTVLTGVSAAADANMLGSLSKLSGTVWMKIPSMIGKGFIGISGAISMYYDGEHMFDEWSKGNYALFILYGISGISTGVLTYIGIFGTGSPLLALAALVVYLVVQFLIVIFTDKDIQKWLQQCLWGKPSDVSLIPFNSLNQERDAFNQLLEATS